MDKKTVLEICQNILLEIADDWCADTQRAYCHLETAANNIEDQPKGDKDERKGY